MNTVQFALLYHKKLIDKIIFPREVFTYQRTIQIDLTELNIKVEDMYLTTRLNKDISVFNFIEPYVSAKFLPYLEYHIADHCNLNCHACGHCSSLVKEPVFPVLEKMINDFEQFHKFIDDFGIIRIMGGEPLLNPDINEYVKLNRRLYPLADIRVVTNAILLPKMSEDFFETLRKNNVSVDISVYPPMRSKIPGIQNLLQSKGIKIGIGSVSRDEFFKNKRLKPVSNIREAFFQNCKGKVCNTMYDGKIAVCMSPFMNKYFNAYFNQNFPTDGYIDLYDESTTTEKIVRHLLKPIKDCVHCGKTQIIKWKQIKHPVALSDWVTDVAAD